MNWDRRLQNWFSRSKGVGKQSKASKLVMKQGPELVARARRYGAHQAEMGQSRRLEKPKMLM